MSIFMMVFVPQNKTMHFWHFLGFIWLFWGVVMVAVGLKWFRKDKENPIWQVGLFIIAMSSPVLYNWYKWEIDTPNFVCPDCETEQIYLVEYIDGDDLRNIEPEEKANCVECKSAFSTLEGRKPLPEPIWD